MRRAELTLLLLELGRGLLWGLVIFLLVVIAVERLEGQRKPVPHAITFAGAKGDKTYDLKLWCGYQGVANGVAKYATVQERSGAVAPDGGGSATIDMPVDGTFCIDRFTFYPSGRTSVRQYQAVFGELRVVKGRRRAVRH
jgi:hypothetical protein